MTENQSINNPKEFVFESLNKEKKFYDIELDDPINYSVKNDSRHEFGLEYAKINPSEGEVRLLGNRHLDCRYYSIGVQMCKQRMNETKYPNYLPCKAGIDAMYRCYTEDKYGDEYHKTTIEAKPYADKFFDCYFRRHTSLTVCMKHFEDSVRAIYRNPDNKLIDYQ
jgi:hypothetical protein